MFFFFAVAVDQEEKAGREDMGEDCARVRVSGVCGMIE